MQTQSEIITFLRENFIFLKNEYKITKIGIFGSFARNEQDENSDIDIILEFETGIKNLYEKKLKLKEYLQSEFHRDVDLCREKYIKPYIKDYLKKEVIYV